MSFLRKFSRALDPTSKTSPLGGLTRSALTALPGGAAVMGAVDGINAGRGSGAAPAALPAVAPVVPGTQPIAPSPMARVKGFLTSKAGIFAGLALAGALVVFLFMKRK